MPKLFFNYSLDCETPPNTHYTGGSERRPFLHGPESWDFADKAVRGFVALMDDLGALDGTSLFVYPDVANEQKGLYREMADAGVETALHLNGLRYSRLTGDKAKWLGEMTYQEQKDALSMAKQDLEEATGKLCNGYRACYGSANDDTFKIIEELGFTWASNARGRFRAETFANWWGSWPHAHHASDRSKLIPGSLNVFEIPLTVGIENVLEGDRNKPFDLRAETPVDLVGEDRKVLRSVIEENLAQMQRMAVPVQTIVGASHNTLDFGDFPGDQSQNVRWVARHTRELCEQQQLEFTPASFEQMLAEAGRMDSY